jgi:DNA-binding transcriptional MerR regulator
MARSASIGSAGYSIRELAEELSISTRSIRLYEDKGLLRPSRRGSGQVRVFSQADRTRLLLTLRGKRLGFSLAEIKSILDLYEGPEGGRAQLEKFLSTLAAHRKELETKLHDIQAQLQEITVHERQCQKLLRKL